LVDDNLLFMSNYFDEEEFLDLRDNLELVAEWCAENDRTVLEANKSKDIGTHFEQSLRDFMNDELGLERRGSAADLGLTYRISTWM